MNENIIFTGYESRIRLLDCSKFAVNWKNSNGATIFRHGVIVNFFDDVLFLSSKLVTSPSFMSISSLVLELGIPKMLLNAAKCQDYRVIKGKPTGMWGVKLLPLPTQINVNISVWANSTVKATNRYLCQLQILHRFSFY